MSTTNPDHHVYVLMGVSGSGKSAVASEVAHQIHAAFLDGDFLHPRSNINKMASGEPLNDDDRKPWLQALNDAAFAMQRTNKVSLIVCSALKKTYRDQLREGNANLSFIYLKGDFDVIESNEAFAAQALAVNKGLGLDPAKVNPNGGAIALGHPVGATGAIITVKALHELERTGGRKALITMCIGGGQGIALAIERI